MTILSCSSVSKWYGDVIAVNDLTVDVQPGITGLLGPNGSGKTSLLRMATGLSKPSAGSLKVLDENPWDNPGLLARIGVVPDADAPWRHLPGHDAALLAAKFSGLEGAEAEAAVEKALRFVRLDNVADRKVEGYSRGMRQRFKFALATLNEPELLLLDEPLIGCDPTSRAQLIDWIKAYAAGGRSVLVSTHVLPDVEAMTQRILLLNNGRLMAHGEVAEIRDLLERYPRTVRIATPKPKELGAEMWNWDSVLTMQAEKDAVVVQTTQPRDFYDQLQRHLVEGRVPFTSITSPDDNVEAVFRYLVR